MKAEKYASKNIGRIVDFSLILKENGFFAYDSIFELFKFIECYPILIVLLAEELPRQFDRLLSRL